jgi:hypothetical protein
VEDLPASRQVNQLPQHVEWVCAKVSDDAVDATSNVSECLIGLNFKMRPKTMRGFKLNAKSWAVRT